MHYATRTLMAALTVLGGWAAFKSGACDAQVSDSGAWALRAVDNRSSSPLEGVLISFPDLSSTRVTNSRGLTAGPAVGTGTLTSASQVRVLAARLGYADLDTLVVVSDPSTIIVLRMERTAVPLPPLTVEAERSLTSRELQRVIFDREVAVGAVGMTQAEMKAVPVVGEADVFRSLQAFAGVASVNDYNGQLYTRGGDGDQVAVLLDGAPVFAPYHMFGIFGVFNPDAIESVEFYRGSIPARHGGALSGVMSARHKTGSTGGTRARGGISFLGARAEADGTAPWAGIRWMAAGRMASVDVARLDIPWSFNDMNLAVDAHPAEKHRLRTSLLASSDEFNYAYFDKSLSSAWSNLVSSASWSWVRDNHVTTNVTAYYSRYQGRIKVGDGEAAEATANGIAATGLRANLVVRGDVTGGRAGVVVEGGPATLQGDGPGAYVHGDLSRSYLHLSAFAEGERWFGPLLVAPGVRVGTDLRASRRFVQPRFSLRYRASAFAVSMSLDRSYQFMSHLRDAHAFMPGAPMWFVHGSDQTATTADGVSVSVDAWRGEEWTASAAVWGRRFRDKPSWRPIRSRAPASLEFHDGSTRGLEVVLRRHGGRVRGWVSYQWAQTTFADADGEYLPSWDRRHEADAMLTAELVGGLSASVRATVGSGAPYWLPVGEFDLVRYDPRRRSFHGRILTEQLTVQQSGHVTLWSDVQGRLPVYARYDVSVRYAFRWGAVEIAPFLSLVNAAGRENVLYYFSPGAATRQMPRAPFVGINFQF